MLRSITGLGIWIIPVLAIRLFALVFHEFSHGWVSTKLGDPTPRIRGRLTFNPLAHLDPWGTVLMLLTGFGWAKPVEVNPMYYKDRKKGMALVAFAGPAANLVLAFLAILINVVFMVVFYVAGISSEAAYSIVNTLCYYAAVVNLGLMVFNLIPIPPLDGSRIAGMFLPDKTYYSIMRYEQYMIIIIMVLSLSGAFSAIIGTGVDIFYNGIEKLLVNAAIGLMGLLGIG